MAGCAYAALAGRHSNAVSKGSISGRVSAQRIVARVVGVLKLDTQVPLYHNVDAALMAIITPDQLVDECCG